MSELPNDSFTWLTKTFIESLLRYNKNIPNLVVLDIKTQRAVPKGENHSSTLARVNIKYIENQQDNTLQFTENCSLIVKVLPVGDVLQEFIVNSGLFAKESQMYEVTLPAIYSLIQKRIGVDVEHIATNIYLSKIPETLILEDLIPLGYKMADRRQGLDLHHSLKAIRTLARLHASSIVLNAEDSTSMESYKETVFVEANRKTLNDLRINTCNGLAEVVETWPGFERFGDKIRSIAPTSFDDTVELMTNKEGAMKVLNHGDFWTNNILFHYEDGKVNDVKMIDFQIVRFASPALDILYFLYTSPSQHILEDFQDQLIQEYLESLNDTLRQLKHKRVVNIEEIQKELKDKAFYAVIVSCVIFVLMVAEPNDGPSLSNMVTEEMDTAASASLSKAYSGKVLRNALQRRLSRFEEQGLL